MYCSLENTTMELNQKKCKPCEGGIPKLGLEEIGGLLDQINKAWELIGETKIRREFHFVNFVQTMDFVNKVADISEKEGHHPEISLGYGHCEIEIWTHAISGLSENDFILAAKIDEVV